MNSAIHLNSQLIGLNWNPTHKYPEKSENHCKQITSNRQAYGDPQCL